MDSNLEQTHRRDMTAIEKCINIFVSPGPTAESIERKSDVVLPAILILIIAIVITMIQVYMQLNDPTIMREMENVQIKLLQKIGLGEQEISRALDQNQPTNNPVFKYGGGLIGAIFSTGFFFMLMTVIYWSLGRLVLRHKADFEKVLALMVYTGLIKYVGALLTIPLIFTQKDLKAGFHLGNLLDPQTSVDFMSTFIHSIAMFINLFDIWTLSALAIGMAIVYKSTTTKASILVFSVWAFFVLLMCAGIAAVSSFLGINVLMMS